MRASTSFLLLVTLVACGKGSKEDRRVCERAGDKYATCVREILGPEMEQLVRNKDGTDACAADSKTVAMYRKCLPTDDCAAFMACLEDYVNAHAPTIPSDLPRTEQCKKHVADGLRGIANQVMMIGEHVRRDDDEKARAQGCIFDESKSWETCIEPAERTEVMRYGVQRQKECEAWSPELAACILRQPGAVSCEPDEYPPWRLPNEEGPPGPKVAWSIDVTDDDDYENDVRFTWIGDRTLIVRDDLSLRSLRAGEENWKSLLWGTGVDIVLAGGWVAVRGTSSERGVHLFDTTSGESSIAMRGTYVDLVGASGDRVLVLAGGGKLHELTPSQCARGKSCTKLLGELDVDDDVYPRAIGTWRDTIVMAGLSSGALLTDRRGKKRLALKYDADDVVLTKDGAVIAFDQRVAVVSWAGCTALGTDVDLAELAIGDCKIAEKKFGWVSSVEIAALADGAVAYNDGGIIEKTHYFTARGAWEARTGGAGGVAGDGSYIYTATRGLDDAGPVRVLALSRETGKVAWQTELPGASPQATEIELSVRDGMLAARVGGKLFVIELAQPT